MTGRTFRRDHFLVEVEPVGPAPGADGPERLEVRSDGGVMVVERLPQRLKPLKHRLLDDAIDHGWNAERALPAAPGLGDHHPTHRLRLVAPLE